MDRTSQAVARDELAVEIVRLGNDALVRALGPAGAIQFLQQINRNTSEAKRDGAERTSFTFDSDPESCEVIVRFNRPVTWLRLRPEAAIQTAKALLKRAQSLKGTDE